VDREGRSPRKDEDWRTAAVLSLKSYAASVDRLLTHDIVNRAAERLRADIDVHDDGRRFPADLSVAAASLSALAR
jgi:hypothetical protein